MGWVKVGALRPLSPTPKPSKALSPRVKRPNKFGAHSDITSLNRFLPAVEKTGLHTELYGERNIGRSAPDVPLPPNYITALSFRRSEAACPDHSGTETRFAARRARRGSVLQSVLLIPTNTCHYYRPSGGEKSICNHHPDPD